MRNLLKTAAVVAAFATPTLGSATTIVGGDTRVAFGEMIEALNPGLLGSATLASASPLTVNFGITGGDLDAALAGTIRHDGSGVSLTNGVNTLFLKNFVIDTTSSLLFGDVALNNMGIGTGLALFSFDLGTVTAAQLVDLSSPMLALRLTDVSSGALASAFGSSLTTGTTIGRAATAPSFVPEAETWALMVIGFGLVGVSVRQRRVRARPIVTTV